MDPIFRIATSNQSWPEAISSIAFWAIVVGGICFCAWLKRK